MTKQETAISLILKERQRQDEKFGWPQEHSIDRWLVILGEEFGELCKAALERDSENFFEEVTQVAAVAVAILETYQR